MASVALAAGAMLSSAGSAAMAGVGSLASAVGLGGGAAAAGSSGVLAGAGSAAAGAAGAAAGGGSILGGISTGMSALSAFSSAVSGVLSFDDAMKRGETERLGARQEIIRGNQEGNEILDGLIDSLARNQVAFGAAGQDGGGLQAGRAADVLEEDGERAINLSRDNAVTRSNVRRAQRRALRRKGYVDLISGIGGALETGGNAFARSAARGTP